MKNLRFIFEVTAITLLHFFTSCTDQSDSSNPPLTDASKQENLTAIDIVASKESTFPQTKNDLESWIIGTEWKTFEYIPNTDTSKVPTIRRFCKNQVMKIQRDVEEWTKGNHIGEVRYKVIENDWLQYGPLEWGAVFRDDFKSFEAKSNRAGYTTTATFTGRFEELPQTKNDLESWIIGTEWKSYEYIPNTDTGKVPTIRRFCKNRVMKIQRDVEEWTKGNHIGEVRYKVIENDRLQYGSLEWGAVFREDFKIFESKSNRAGYTTTATFEGRFEDKE